MQHALTARRIKFALRLSVSSIGSEAMQRRGSSKLLPSNASFQYPQSDRRRCNSRAERRRWTSALSLSVSSIGSEAMQRGFASSVEVGGGDLSVSSIGSEAMQRLPERIPSIGSRTFSILNRIGGDATVSAALRDAALSALSVSSIGSEAMQLLRNPPNDSGNPHFQYPQSDRRRCNPSSPIWWRTAKSLSVSSIGSEAMQLAFGRTFPRYSCSFSILNRIGGDATLPGPAPPSG